MTKVSAYTATLPERAHLMRLALASILPKVDTVQIVLNNFKEVPKFCYHPKVTFVHHDNSKEDGSRFIGIEKAAPGYTLVFDDDIIYPQDYVGALKSALNFYPMVCPMGKILKPRPIESYYKGWLRNFKTFSHVENDCSVDIPGACGIMWDNRIVKVTEDIIKIPNSDVCLAVFCKQNNIKPVVISHTENWLKNIFTNVPKNTPSIFGKYRNNDKVITDFINLNL